MIVTGRKDGTVTIGGILDKVEAGRLWMSVSAGGNAEIEWTDERRTFLLNDIVDGLPIGAMTFGVEIPLTGFWLAASMGHHQAELPDHGTTTVVLDGCYRIYTLCAALLPPGPVVDEDETAEARAALDHGDDEDQPETRITPSFWTIDASTKRIVVKEGEDELVDGELPGRADEPGVRLVTMRDPEEFEAEIERVHRLQGPRDESWGQAREAFRGIRKVLLETVVPLTELAIAPADQDGVSDARRAVRGWMRKLPYFATAK